MAKTPTVTTITSGYASNTQLNANFVALRDAFNNTLSLDGSTPNAMGAALDMNSKDILNVNDVHADRLLLNGVPVSTSAVTVDSESVTYTPEFTGAVTSNVEAKLQETISVKDFGAVGDGVTDDTVALQAMVSYVNSLDRARVVFNGYFKTTQKLSFTCSNLTLDFEVKGKDGLLCSGCDGIEVIQTGKYDNFSSDNMLLVTDAHKLYTGFKYQNTAASTGDQPIKTMRTPTFIGMDRFGLVGSPYNDGWLTAIRVDNGDRFFIHTPWLQGAEQDRVDAFPIASKGVYGTDTTHLVLHDPQIFIFETGVEIGGQSEGCEIIGGSLVANRKGVNFNPSGGPANDTNIRGTHIASMDYNINLGGGTASTIMHDITGCLLFTRTEAYVSSTFKHIITDGQASISGNFFFTAAGISPTNHIGVDIVQPPTGSAYNVQVLGNLFYTLPTIVQTATGVLNTLIANNSTRDDGVTVLAAPVVDNGSGTTIGLNYGDRDFGEVKSDTGVFWAPTGSPGFYVGSNKNKALTATQGSAAAVNYLDVVNAATGTAPYLRSTGTDANIDLRFVPKGTGRMRFGTHTASADVPVTGYIEILDTTGTLRKLAVIG